MSIAAGMMIAGFGGAAFTWYTSPGRSIRGKMRKAFLLGGLYLKRKRGKKDVLTFPVIDSVKVDKDITVTFTVPIGLDPGDVHKHLWVFRQTFGDVSLSGDTRRFTLTCYAEDITPFDYDAEGIATKLEGHRLPIVAGISRQGWEVYDMVEYPHLLIAGETGSGKSTQLRAILTTLIRHTDAVLYLADLKRSEFHLFRGCGEVVNDVDKLKPMLRKIQKELKRRGDLLDAAGVAHVDDLVEKLPYLVLCVDEVALLQKEKDCMEIIEEISAIGRALGVFLILSMQRPDADVLDGKLKNNLTVRMAFRHSDELNSRITLGSGEAAHISQKQKGRMWLKLNGVKQVQGPYLDLEKARKLLDGHKKPTPKGEPIDVEAYVVSEEKVFGVLE